MAAVPVLPHDQDPVYVRRIKDKIWLEIGGNHPGKKGRARILLAREARILSYALLQAAEAASSN